jgi:ectoine hydroxylase-related dioxygenase (phytanoyl-CoA dioxygenase family)
MKDAEGQHAGYFDDSACDLDAFLGLISQETQAADYPHATRIAANIPVYSATGIGPVLRVPARRRGLMAEWARALMSGPGVLVLTGTFRDSSAIDRATEVFEAVIADEKKLANTGADHFAASGANDRVWNSLQKLCLRAPDVHLRYFANLAVAAICEAWLGPNYQMTAQVNLVHPGGTAQSAHRDYHLGFQTVAQSMRYPAHVHALSPLLTLQGAIAHCDMPVESGPTKLLPYSQAFRAGYVAWRRDDFRAAFERNCVQVPLLKGDAVFFNPALFHAAGANKTDNIHRMANLLQVSSPFGRTMESIDRDSMCRALYPLALERAQARSMPKAELDAVIAATAEGYSFPTNLDSDPPVDGLAPESQKALFRRALDAGMSPEDFSLALDALKLRRTA